MISRIIFVTWVLGGAHELLSKASDEGLKFKLENFWPRKSDKRVNEVIIERLMNGKPPREVLSSRTLLSFSSFLLIAF